MNRHYTAAQYRELIDYARAKIPGVTFSSDIIVGFPGETEEDFQATLDLVESVGYMQLFTFIYSKREGTPAAKMDDPTPRAEKTARMERLLAVQEKYSHAAVAALGRPDRARACRGRGPHAGHCQRAAGQQPCRRIPGR